MPRHIRHDFADDVLSLGGFDLRSWWSQRRSAEAAAIGIPRIRRRGGTSRQDRFRGKVFLHSFRGSTCRRRLANSGVSVKTADLSRSSRCDGVTGAHFLALRVALVSTRVRSRSGHESRSDFQDLAQMRRAAPPLRECQQHCRGESQRIGESIRIHANKYARKTEVVQDGGRFPDAYLNCKSISCPSQNLPELGGGRRHPRRSMGP